MSITHAIRTDSGKQIGFGHLKRCLILADALRERKGIPKIVLGQADSDTISIMENSKHIWSQLNQTDHFDLQPIAGEAKVIIFDLSHKQTLPRSQCVAQLLRQARKTNVKTLLIDSQGDDCLSALSQMEVDTLVIPYAGAEQQITLPGPVTHAKGVGFFVINPAFTKINPEKRAFENPAKQLLITAGGSDPNGLTLTFLQAIQDLPQEVTVTVLLGPNFGDGLIKESIKFAQNIKQTVRLIQSPDNLSLVKAMCSADLALSASGLTKYELAYLGTPALLMSIDEAHYNVNREFNKLGTCYDAGWLDKAVIPRLTEQIKELLCDTDRRQAYSMAGRQSVDGLGIKRVLELVDDLTT